MQPTNKPRNKAATKRGTRQERQQKCNNCMAGQGVSVGQGGQTGETVMTIDNNYNQKSSTCKMKPLKRGAAEGQSGAAERVPGQSGRGARIAGSQAVMQSGHNYLSGGRQGCQRWRQRLPQHCNFDVLATGWSRHTIHIDTPAHTQWHTGWPDDSSVQRAVRGQ